MTTNTRKSEQPAKGADAQTLDSYVVLFNRKSKSVSQNIKELAGIYYEALQKFPDSAEDRFADKCRVSRYFLRCLVKVSLGELVPELLWQSRGYRRVFSLPVSDQEALVREGLDTLCDGGIVRTIRLSDMSPSQIVQVVTPLGRVRSVEEQATVLEAQRLLSRGMSERPEYDMSRMGIRFRSGRAFSPEALRGILEQWEAKYAACAKKTAKH